MVKVCCALMASLLFLCGCSGHNKVIKNAQNEEIISMKINQASTDDDWESADIVIYNHGDLLVFDEKEDIDPLEPMNRAIFKFNKVIDNLLLKPVAIIYDRVIPDAGKNSIRNFLHNLASPLKMVYGIMSLNPEMTSREFARFIINTTFGTLGIHDAASRHPKLQFKPYRGDDLLKGYGGKNGPYIVLPIVGPSSARGSFGLLVDIVMDSLVYTAKEGYSWTRAGVMTVDSRADLLKFTDMIDETATDEYVTIRSMYLQNRR